MAVKKLLIKRCKECTNLLRPEMICKKTKVGIGYDYKIPGSCPLESGVARYDLRKNKNDDIKPTLRGLFRYNFARMMREQDLILTDIMRALDVSKPTVHNWLHHGVLPRDDYFYYVKLLLNAEYGDFFKEMKND